MPASNYSVGRDVSLTIYTSAGVIATAALTSFSAKQMTAAIKIINIKGEVLPAFLPEGWQGDFEFYRADSSLDDYFAKLENNYYAGQDLPTVAITTTITEVNGSVSVYRFSDVALDFSDAGDWAGNKEVRQKLSFVAGRRRKLA